MKETAGYGFRVTRVTGESEWAVMVVRECPGVLQKQAEVSPWSVQV